MVFIVPAEILALMMMRSITEGLRKPPIFVK